MISCSLLVLAVGYFVFAHATSQKGEVQTVGRILGIVIILAALAGVACGVACKSSSMSCGMSGKHMMKGFCPIKSR